MTGSFLIFDAFLVLFLPPGFAVGEYFVRLLDAHEFLLGVSLFLRVFDLIRVEFPGQLPPGCCYFRLGGRRWQAQDLVSVLLACRIAQVDNLFPNFIPAKIHVLRNIMWSRGGGRLKVWEKLVMKNVSSLIKSFIMKAPVCQCQTWISIENGPLHRFAWFFAENLLDIIKDLIVTYY